MIYQVNFRPLISLLSSEVARKSASDNFLFELDGDNDMMIRPSLMSTNDVDDI